MKKPFKLLQLRQAAATLDPLIARRLPAKPSRGWIHAIRTALGMSAVALGRRVAVRSPSAVKKYEQAEIDETISLGTLRKVAAALGCELQYALVPMKPLETLLEDRAYEVARAQLSAVAHTMALEDQAVSPGAQPLQVELLAKELLAGSRRDLW